MRPSGLFTIVAAVAVLAWLAGGTLAAFAAGVTVYTDVVNKNQGDTFDLPIMINTDTGIRGYQFNLQFDASRLTVNSVTDGGFVRTAGAGACLVPVAPVIDNAAGTVKSMSCSLLGGAGETVQGVGMLAKVNVTVKSAAPNGKALFSFVALTGAPTALKILDVNAAAMPGAVAAPKWVQVGPGPNVGLAIGFTPLGTGESFNVKVIVSNSLPAGSPSDPDTLVVSATNVTAGGPFTFSVPSLAVGASVEFPLPAALVLNTGASTSVVTAQLTGLGLSKSATYSPVSDSGQTPVDATFGAFLKMVPPAPLSFGQLQLGVNVITTSLTVMANTGFEVAVNDEGLTAWRLTQFDGVSYQAAQLSEPLRISSPQNPNVTAGTDKTLVSGEVSGQAGDQGQDFPVTLVQVLHYSDPVLPPGETYHLVLTFNSYVTL